MDNLNEKNILLEIYKTHVQTAENANNRRLHSNIFYLTFCSFFITAIYAFYRMKIDNVPFIVGICIFGACISLIWFFNICSYKSLSNRKLKVIHTLEEKLLTEEWETVVHKGSPSKAYCFFTKVERYIPIFFTLLFIAMIYFSIFSPQGYYSGYF